jgi:hypothetical protein
MKNSSDLIGNWTRNLPACSTEISYDWLLCSLYLCITHIQNHPLIQHYRNSAPTYNLIIRFYDLLTTTKSVFINWLTLMLPFWLSNKWHISLEHLPLGWRSVHLSWVLSQTDRENLVALWPDAGMWCHWCLIPGVCLDILRLRANPYGLGY